MHWDLQRYASNLDLITNWLYYIPAILDPRDSEDYFLKGLPFLSMLLSAKNCDKSHKTLVLFYFAEWILTVDTTLYIHQEDGFLSTGISR